MSFIAKNPLIASETSASPPTPPDGTRGLFPTKDGWYEIDDEGNITKLGSGSGGGNGSDGKSAYEIALDNGFYGTEEEWLESLQGEDGKDGYTPQKGVDYFTAEDIESLNIPYDEVKSLQYYEDASVVPSDASLFTFKVNEDGKTASIIKVDNGISGDIVVPYECVIGGMKYGVTSIGDYAFHSHESLTSIIIPHSVTSIGSAVFEACYGLTNITIPNSVTSIGEYTFEGCDSLANVYFRGIEEQYFEIIIGEYNAGLFNATIHYEWADVTKEYVDEQISKAVINNSGIVVVDNELNIESENPVQNKVITEKFNEVDREIQSTLNEAYQSRQIIDTELKPNIQTALDDSGQAYNLASQALSKSDENSASIQVLQLEKADIVYVDEKIGDIDAALLEIIEIQESLMIPDGDEVAY